MKYRAKTKNSTNKDAFLTSETDRATRIDARLTVLKCNLTQRNTRVQSSNATAETQINSSNTTEVLDEHDSAMQALKGVFN
ncbi:hypothetical protein RRG08_043456 [Elysia crispata]|uniref:Uncharacterized protein n=1 Tax=Elysia crispata TaxID=231223 RepID=A0AAE0XPX1_9GAST|nr:hypothetical protein RRG08_043456 [Elysia crispata]